MGCSKSLIVGYHGRYDSALAISFKETRRDRSHFTPQATVGLYVIAPSDGIIMSHAFPIPAAEHFRIMDDRRLRHGGSVKAHFRDVTTKSITAARQSGVDAMHSRERWNPNYSNDLEGNIF